MKKKLQLIHTSSLVNKGHYYYFKYFNVDIDRPIFIFNDIEYGHIKISVIPYEMHIKLVILPVMYKEIKHHFLHQNNLYLVHFDSKKVQNEQRLILVEYDNRPF